MQKYIQPFIAHFFDFPSAAHHLSFRLHRSYRLSDNLSPAAVNFAEKD
jgi:hypothetical protein